MLTLTHETWQMAILAAPAAVVALTFVTLILAIIRRQRWALVLAVVTLALNSATEQIPIRMRRDVTPSEKGESTIRVFEYNICAKAEYYPIHHQPEFVDFVLGQDADLLFLPENTAGVAVDLEQRLKEAYPYSLHSFKEFEYPRSSYADYSIYSRFQLSDYRNYKLDNKQLLADHPYLDSVAVMDMGTHFMAYEVTAQIHGRAVTLLHLHMRSNSYDTAKSEGNRKREKAHNVYDRLLMGYAFRAAEARIVADSLRNCPNPVLICGDMNDLSGSYALRTMQDCRRNNIHEEHRDRLRDVWWECGQGFGFTFVDQHLWLRLDHILYSKEFKPKGVSVPRVPFSDHRPLVADFELEPIPSSTSRTQ